MSDKYFVLLYPTQLFDNIKLFDDLNCKFIYLIEEPLYFTRFKFHKLKLILHRASMKYYYDFLSNKIKSSNIKYINFDQLDYNQIFNDMKNKNITTLKFFDPVEHSLLDKIEKLCNKFKFDIKMYNTLSFIETLEDLDDYYNNHTDQQHFYHDSSFYRYQRRKLDILLDSQDKNKPMYGQWSFDKENRNKFDKSYEEPKTLKIQNNKYITEARKYINKHFKNNFGDDENMVYPIDHKSAKKLFNDFIKYRLETFGKYQDAVSENIIFGSHSVLSSSINIGLITPKYIIKKTLEYFDNLNETKKKEVINSVEGFIRQVIGWRSFTRFMYQYNSQMYDMNRLKHKNKINNNWYNATTDIKPIDILINKAKKYAYLHHIERLMYIGNFSLLTNIDPKEIYKWFMICFIDSYEWVMISNVMGMSQFSLTNISMMTRPYFSSSNYILKMSDFKKDNWCDIWDGLYYKFINDNRDILKKIYATASSVGHWNRKSKEEQKELLKIANNYIKEYI